MRIKWLLLISMLFLTTIIGSTQLRSLYQAETVQGNDQHNEWIRDSLLKIETIKVGMNRGQLLKVFTTEGGLSSPLQRTYVYRECPYIKVHVKFTAVGRPERDSEGRATSEESDEDIIKEISIPFLQFPIYD
ncbi:MAG: hypothetical protein J2P41_19415 [Blastocatellia bacterium]|nr:hypothetical protein [Blastocatellia bacterium]